MSISKTGSTGRVTVIVEAIAASPGSTLTEIAERTAAPLTTVHRIILQLVQLGWIAADTDRRYYLTGHLYSLAVGAVEQLDIQDLSRPYLRSLAEQTCETVHLAVRDQDWVVFIARVGGQHPLSMRTPAGTRQLIEQMAVGRAILAHTTNSEILSKVRRRLHDNDYEILQTRLSRIRDRGYEIDDEEFVQGARGIAAPVFSPIGVAGAISVVGPSIRITHEAIPIIAKHCLEISHQISEVLGGAPKGANLYEAN